MSIVIRPLASTDLRAATAIHLEAFPDSALTKLGDETVRRYYAWQMADIHDALNIGAFEDNTLCGYCFSGVFRGSLGGFLDANRPYLIWRVLTHPALLLNPLFRERAAFALQRLVKRFRPNKARKEKLNVMIADKGLKPLVQTSQIDNQPPVPTFGILAIAVARQYLGSDVAPLLMAHCEQVAVERGFSRMGLTVHPSNGRAVRFYEKLGWERAVENGVWSGHMSKMIASQDDNVS